MKKVICLLAAIVMMFALAACESKDINDDGKSNSSASSGSHTNLADADDHQATEPSGSDQSGTKADEPDRDTKTVNIPGEDIYVSCSTLLRTTKQSRTVIMHDSMDMLVGLAFDPSEYNGELKDVVALVNDKFMSNISGYTRGDLYGRSIEVVSSEKTSIAGYESVRFEGTVLNEETLDEETWNCHVYGYTFIIDHIPCAVIGLVSAREQEASMIEQLDRSVDEIAATIRTTE